MLFTYKVYLYGNKAPVTIEAISEKKAIDKLITQYGLKMYNIQCIEKL